MSRLSDDIRDEIDGATETHGRDSQLTAWAAQARGLEEALRSAFSVMSGAAQHAIADTEEGHPIPRPYARLDEELRFVRFALARAGVTL